MLNVETVKKLAHKAAEEYWDALPAATVLDKRAITTCYYNAVRWALNQVMKQAKPCSGTILLK